jgi:hypothetical protein
MWLHVTQPAARITGCPRVPPQPAGASTAQQPPGALLASLPLLALPEQCCAEVQQLAQQQQLLSAQQQHQAAAAAAGSSSSSSRSLAGSWEQMKAFTTDLGILLELQQEGSVAAAAAAAWCSSEDAARAAVVGAIKQQVLATLAARRMQACLGLLSNFNPAQDSGEGSAAEPPSTVAQPAGTQPAAPAAGPAGGPPGRRPEVTLRTLLRGFASPQLERQYGVHQALGAAQGDKLAALITTAFIPVAYYRCWQEGNVHIVAYWGLAMYLCIFTLQFWALVFASDRWRVKYRQPWVMACQCMSYWYMYMPWASWVPQPRWLAETQTNIVFGLLSGAVFTPVIVQLRLVPAMAITAVHAFTTDVLCMSIAYNSRVVGVLFALVMLAVSGVTAGLKDWRCRLRFIHALQLADGAQKAGKQLEVAKDAPEQRRDELARTLS